MYAWNWKILDLKPWTGGSPTDTYAEINDRKIEHTVIFSVAALKLARNLCVQHPKPHHHTMSQFCHTPEVPKLQATCTMPITDIKTQIVEDKKKWPTLMKTGKNWQISSLRETTNRRERRSFEVACVHALKESACTSMTRHNFLQSCSVKAGCDCITNS